MRRFINGVLSFLTGAILLCLFFILQKMIIHYHPITLKVYLVPILFGGISGLILGTWRLKLKHRQEKNERLNLMLHVIQDVNQLLIVEKDRNKLLQGICDNLIKNHGYYNAIWIIVLDGTGRLVTTSEAGWDKEFLLMTKQLKRGNLPDCARLALMQSNAVLIKDPFSTCTNCPLSKKHRDLGAMIVRLEYGGKIYGILSVSIQKRFLPDEKENNLLKGVAGDIAFALHSIELEEERKQMENALLESEKRFRHLVENALTGIFIIQNDQIVYKNPEQERLFGPLHGSFKFTNFKNIHSEDVGKVKEKYESLISRKVPSVYMDFRFYPMGKMDSKIDMKWVYCRASLIEYKGEEAILLNMMDITRAKELEHLLRIQDKMSSLGRVSIGIAHEIRNPLSGINIYLSTLEKIYDKGEDLEKVKKIIGQLQSASSKIESVIRRVMDFSKPAEPKFVFTDINKPIEEAINLSSASLRKSRIRLEKALAKDLPLCNVDPQLITEVILNLITNSAEAMKKMEGVRKIKITSFMEKGHILVSVSDTGPGVPSNLREKLFDPFYTTKHGNTGIGLSISHRIITDHGGTLGVFKSKWGGAEFVIDIPLEKGKDRDDFIQDIYR